MMTMKLGPCPTTIHKSNGGDFAELGSTLFFFLGACAWIGPVFCFVS